MNYRHVFHAGNFADCMKHAVLVWLMRAMARSVASVPEPAGIALFGVGAVGLLLLGRFRRKVAREEALT